MFDRRSLPVVLTGLALVLLAGCPDKKPKFPACEGDKDCKAGQHCVNKMCLDCGEDSHCPAGETCQKGGCVKIEGFCTSNDQCDPGQVCQDGRCGPCQADGDCGPGALCQTDGSCRRATTCTKDEDCADDEDCMGGVCKKPWQSGAGDVPACPLQIVYFDHDQASIRPDSRQHLNALAECLPKAKQGLYIIGHADESGTEEYNIALAERRARAVADYLARLGIDPARLLVLSKGEAQVTGRGSDADRRVEFEWQ